MMERQREGIAKAKLEGKPTARLKADEARSYRRKVGRPRRSRGIGYRQGVYRALAADAG
jgi:hypothetical protein